MCGIAGIYSLRPLEGGEEQLAARRRLCGGAVSALRHRGPDGDGIYLEGPVGLVHTRLAIIDPKGAPQPMKKRRGERDHVLVYNGELYNTPELRRELKGKGWAFETASDTETLLCGLMEEGPAFLKKLNGIFAFGYWDGEQLLLARDPLGVKPLYYSAGEDVLRFGSEPKALFALGLKPAVGKRGLQELFALGPAHTPGTCVFEQMAELLPGEFLLAGPGQIRKSLYWRLESRPHTDSLEETADHVGWLVKDSVERQMVSDVPICTFLSGGLDSSLAASLCAKKLREQGKRLTTFSFDFKGNDEYYRENAFQPSRDAPFALEMAEYLGTDHIQLECDNALLADLLDSAMRARDLPGMADIDASLLYFCTIVGKQFKVTLTGECADEIFGGYPWFRSKQAFAAKAFPWSQNMAPRRSLLREDLLDALQLEAYAQAAYEASVAETPRLEGDSPEEARRREIAWLNLRWFMQTLLDRMDRMSMSSSLEARVPFADPRILEYVWNVPWHMKYRDNTTKYLLRMAGRGLLPERVLWRKKSPYPKTYHPLYEQLLAARMRDILRDKNQPLHQFIDPQKTEAFLRQPAGHGQPWYGQLMSAPQRVAYFLQVNAWLKEYRL
ncbi:MAG: asparagine synthase (glutamine-hydrolyzing) [Oscillospiraceae bacterium]|jgi:asparagine synthase (glutamine-hydrolysing)|nr:asparagine synthase (glutamine-hydrolyzing) [Oscillospiraceae bacterium]